MLRCCALLLVALATASCSSPAESTDGSVKIPSTTKVLETDTLTALELVSADLQTLTFSSEPALLSSLSPGDVLVSDVFPPLLPHGLLRKVERIERAAGKVVITTGTAALTDAIEEGSLQQTFTLVPESRQTTLAGNGFVFGFNNVELYEGVKLNGNVAFKPTVSLDLDIGLFTIKKLVFEVGSDQQSSIQIVAGREATFEKEYLVEQMTLTPITFAIGPVPVVLVPIIRLLVGFDGKVPAGMTTGLTADARVKIGFGYHEGSFAPISELSTSGQVEAPQFPDGAKAQARAWAGPRVELAAYGLAGVQGTLRGYVRGEVDTGANPWWRLFAGVQALAGVFVNIIGLDYETPVVNKELELKHADGAAPSHSSTGPVLWARSYGGERYDYPVAIVTTADSGSLFVGETNSFSASPSDGWVVKLDALGHLSWQRALEDLGTVSAVQQTDDEGYLLVAGAVGTSADKVHLVRLDRNGELVWAKQWSAAKELAPTKLVRSSDGAFLLAGGYGALAQRDFWLTKFDEKGTVMWSKAYGGDKEERADGLLADDEAILLAGPTSSFGVSFNGQWVLKLDQEGKIVWQETIDGAGNELAHAVVADGSGGYFVVGSTFNDGLVSRLDGNGALSWSNTYDAGTPYDEVYGGIPSGDGGLFLAGKTDLAEKSDTWILRLTPAGKVQWTISYGGPQEDTAGGISAYAGVSRALVATAEGGLLCASTTFSFPTQTAPDAWIMQVASDGTLSPDAASGAKATHLSGTYASYAQKRAVTSVAAVNVTITSSNEAVKLFSTTAKAATQAGLP